MFFRECPMSTRGRARCAALGKRRRTMMIRQGARTMLMGAALGLLPLAQAAAQTLTNTDTTNTGDYAGNSGAQVTVQFNANLQNAIQLTLTGIADGAASTTIAGNTATGTLDFGTF